jgi:hypothetical protein
MWVSRKGEVKAFDRREWAFIMREAKAKCKRKILPKNKTKKKWQEKTGIQASHNLRTTCWVFQ